MSVDTQLIRSLEEISTNALPCLETVFYDGWVLRFANAYPRRANSIHLFHESTLPLDEKIDYCERLYGTRGWKTVYKLISPALWEDDLVPRLLAHGYQPDVMSDIQVTETLPDSGGDPHGVEVELLPCLTPEWLADNARLHEFSDEQTETYSDLLRRIVPPAGFVRLRQDGRTVALGLGVAERGWVGLYSVITAPDARRQGFGTMLIQVLFDWARGQGATRSYLQVMTSNTAAQRLYRRMGYAPLYSYQYYQKSPTRL